MRVATRMGNLPAVLVINLVVAAAVLAKGQPNASVGPEVGKPVPPLTAVADDVAQQLRKLMALE